METEEDVPILLSPVEAEAASLAVTLTLLRPKEAARSNGFLDGDHLFRPFLLVDYIGSRESIVQILWRQPHGLVSNRKPRRKDDREVFWEVCRAGYSRPDHIPLLRE